MMNICNVCGYQTAAPQPSEIGSVRGNTRRFLGRKFALWKCPQCASIHSLDPVDFEDIYRDYPVNRRKLDLFARGTYRNLLHRLRREGLQSGHSVLDYGCGNGIFLQFMRGEGFRDVTGYDPFVPEFAAPPARQFDCVVANDVIEHVADPRALVGECARLAKPGGLVYIGTADSEPVKMNNLEPHLMRLHQPFHRVVLTQASLARLAMEPGLKLLRAYRRSYMDRLVPFSNYRFLDEFNKALGHNMDRAFEPGAAKVMVRRPALWFWAFLGYFFPSAFEPAVVLRKESIQ
jgi:SAM-dependent methyltransferase